jgi:uncharacterized protein YbgA (DUF1722 family)
VSIREDKVADVAGQIELLLQKWERKHFAQSETEYRHHRTMLTAAIYQLADTIVNGGKDG